MKVIRVTNPFKKPITVDGVKVPAKKTKEVGRYFAEKAHTVSSLKKRGYIVRVVEVGNPKVVVEAPKAPIDPTKTGNNNSGSAEPPKDPGVGGQKPGENDGKPSKGNDNTQKPENPDKTQNNKPVNDDKKANSGSTKA